MPDRLRLRLGPLSENIRNFIQQRNMIDLREGGLFDSSFDKSLTFSASEIANITVNSMDTFVLVCHSISIRGDNRPARSVYSWLCPLFESIPKRLDSAV